MVSFEQGQIQRKMREEGKKDKEERKTVRASASASRLTSR